MLKQLYFENANKTNVLLFRAHIKLHNKLTISKKQMYFKKTLHIQNKRLKTSFTRT